MCFMCNVKILIFAKRLFAFCLEIAESIYISSLINCCESAIVGNKNDFLFIRNVKNKRKRYTMHCILPLHNTITYKTGIYHSLVYTKCKAKICL